MTPQRRNSISDLTDIIPKKAPSTRKTITDKVLEALISPDILNKIIPILSEKICETIEATIKDIVDDKIKTHVGDKTVDHTLHSYEDVQDLEDEHHYLQIITPEEDATCTKDNIS